MKSIVFTIFYFLGACSSQNSETSTNPSNGGSGKDPADTAGGKVNPQNSSGGGSTFAVTDVDQIVVAPGDTVTFSGTELNTQLKIQSAAGIASVGDSTLQLLNPTTAKYTIPLNTASGVLDLTAYQGDVSQKLTLFSTTTANKSYPVISAPLETICSDIKFLDINGKLQNGTRNCSSTSSLNLCVSDGQVNCVANSMYTAAQSGDLASKIISGSTVAGVSGNVILPTADHVLSGTKFGISGAAATGTLTLPRANNVRSGTGAFGIGGNSLIPTLLDCSTDGATGCVAVGPIFSAAFTTGLASKIVKGNTVGGVTGITVASPADCSADGATGCVAVPSYPAAKLESFSAVNVQSGYTIAGVPGTATIRPACVTDGEQNCTVSGVFKAANVSGISAWDLRTYNALAGINGALKTNCRNSIKSQKFNHDNLNTLGVGSDTSGTANDLWDTTDDYFGWSTVQVAATVGYTSQGFWWGWADHNCGSETWTDVTTIDAGTSNVGCGTANTCIYMDKVTNVRVTGVLATQAWNNAVRVCATSTYGGYPAGFWRLPTQKELMALYEHGITSLANMNYFMTLAQMQPGVWSSSTVSYDPTSAWVVSLAGGNVYPGQKSNGTPIVCVTTLL